MPNAKTYGEGETILLDNKKVNFKYNFKYRKS